MELEAPVLDWLLDSDPALRWQIERDLQRASPAVWEATRRRIATEGFGAELLARQDPDGQWAGGAYFPAGYDPAAEGGDGQPWTATTWTLNTLRDWGLEAAALAGTAEQLAAHSRWEYDDLPYWDGEVDCCINAFTLANGAWLGADVSALPGWFADHRLPDGGWNCEWVEGSVRSSFHSTINVVAGLLSYERTTGAGNEVTALRQSGQEYLLERRLRYRLSTGEPVGTWTTWLGYPFRWVCSPLRAVDHFRTASCSDGTPPDPRLADAVDVIRSARQPDGRWLQGEPLPGAVWFEVDAPPGAPSRWLTFHAARALQWWDGAHH
jgi:hypothetical protein